MLTLPSPLSSWLPIKRKKTVACFSRHCIMRFLVACPARDNPSNNTHMHIHCSDDSIWSLLKRDSRCYMSDVNHLQVSYISRDLNKWTSCLCQWEQHQYMLQYSHQYLHQYSLGSQSQHHLEPAVSVQWQLLLTYNTGDNSWHHGPVWHKWVLVPIAFLLQLCQWIWFKEY